MKSLVVLFALLCCTYTGVAKTALPVSICEADLTTPRSCAPFKTTQRASTTVRRIPTVPRKQNLQGTSSQQSSATGIIIALCLCMVLGAGAYVWYKKA
jgi:hypothetical protein